MYSQRHRHHLCYRLGEGGGTTYLFVLGVLSDESAFWLPIIGASSSLEMEMSSGSWVAAAATLSAVGVRSAVALPLKLGAIIVAVVVEPAPQNNGEQPVSINWPKTRNLRDQSREFEAHQRRPGHISASAARP